jgi:hypothetical protein
MLGFLVFVVGVSSALARSDASTLTVTSSLDGKSARARRTPWIAHPPLASSHGNGAEVGYFIGGFRGVETHAARPERQ